MRARALTWACLLLLGGTQVNGKLQAGEELPFNQHEMELPISIRGDLQAGIEMLEIYYSRDRGKNWVRAGSAKPQEKFFLFTASEDGPYWFAVLIVDKRGRKMPATPYEADIAQKLLIDTLRPDIEVFSATRGETNVDQVKVRWAVRDDNPATESMVLEYRVGDAPQWETARVKQTMTGEATLPVGKSAVALRLKIRDAAGNWAEAETRINGYATSNVVASNPGGTVAVPPAPRGISAPPPPPGAGEASAPPPVSTNEPHSILNEVDQPTDNPPVETGSLPATAIADTANTNVVAPGRPGETSDRNGWRQPETIPVISNSRVTLQYEVAKLGPSGVGDVELYVTRNDASTWEKYDRVQHLGAATGNSGRQPAGSMLRSLAVDLNEEGVYGFYLVVKSGAGLGHAGPRPGSAPHMRLELDTTMPVAALYPLAGHPNQSNALILRWKATDKNLSGKPIALHWAAEASGPWETIGDRQMANTGAYTWLVPTNVPARVYLRLTVEDLAGNRAVAQTPEPVLVDLHKPEVKSLRLIRGAGLD